MRLSSHNPFRCPSPLTPANQDVPPEVFPLGDEGQGQQGLQIHALHQQPEVIGQDAELEESHGRLARRLEEARQRAESESTTARARVPAVLFGRSTAGGFG